MRFLQILAAFLLPTLLPVKASLNEAKKFLAHEYEYTMTYGCKILSSNRLAFQTDLMNDTKLENYAESLHTSYENRFNMAQVLKSIRVPFVIEDEDTAREIKLASTKPWSFMIIKEVAKTFAEMERTYNTAKVCPYYYPNCNLTEKGLSVTEIEDVMVESRDYDKLEHYWMSWKAATAKLRGMFKSFYLLENNITKDVSDAKEKDEYIGGKFSYVLDLWREVEPLYLELHKYVGYKLSEYYEDKLNISDGLLPTHVVFSIWTNSWNNIEHLVRPFPNVSDGDLGSNMEAYPGEDMFLLADRFYQSLGLASMGTAYMGSDQMIRKPRDGRNVTCYPTVYDFCNGTSKLTMCAKTDLETYLTIYRELAHIQYFMQYERLPYAFRESPSEAFPKSIGGIFGLSAVSESYLTKIQALTDYQDTYESSINFLMKMALIKIPFLSFAMIADMWRWNVVTGKVAENEWNSLWWEYREKYQRIRPPVPRSHATDFDPAAHYLLSTSANIMAHYDASFLEFQIYKAMCLLAEEYDPVMKKICPLHKCNLFNSTEVGKKLKEVLRMGNRKEWPDMLLELTGSSKITSEPLLDYFQPLYEFLKKENGEVEEEKRKANEEKERADKEKEEADKKKEKSDKEKEKVDKEKEKADKEEEVDGEESVPKVVHHTLAVVTSVIVILIITTIGVYFKFLRGRRIRINAFLRGR